MATEFVLCKGIYVNTYTQVQGKKLTFIPICAYVNFSQILRKKLLGIGVRFVAYHANKVLYVSVRSSSPPELFRHIVWCRKLVDAAADGPGPMECFQNSGYMLRNFMFFCCLLGWVWNNALFWIVTMTDELFLYAPT
jgi:hypothetical protein